jgi:glycosyltransferase involved in cell wall biosynthesis
MKNKNKVSIVIGLYNAAPYLAFFRANVLGCQSLPLEVIAVDDGSTDSTPDMLDSIRRSDSRVRVIRQEKKGLTSALIIGCKEAEGE